MQRMKEQKNKNYMTTGDYGVMVRVRRFWPQYRAAFIRIFCPVERWKIPITGIMKIKGLR